MVWQKDNFSAWKSLRVRSRDGECYKEGIRENVIEKRHVEWKIRNGKKIKGGYDRERREKREEKKEDIKKRKDVG